MRRAPVALLSLALALAAAPAAATAAELKTEAGCYQENTDVVFSGTGFAPSSTVSVALDGEALGTAQTDAAGVFQRKFRTPELGRDQTQRTYELSATDAMNQATAQYRSTRIFADFDPNRGDPSKLRVRFEVRGFALRSATPNPPVYLHYVNPNGKLRRTIKLGSAQGSCGVIARTKQRRLFPFPDVQRGTWILQFDTRKRYTRATNQRRSPWVRKPVEVSSGGR